MPDYQEGMGRRMPPTDAKKIWNPDIGETDDKKPTVNSREELFELFDHQNYSHTPDKDSGITQDPSKKNEFSIVCSMGSAPIKSNAKLEQLQQWYREYYPQTEDGEDEVDN